MSKLSKYNVLIYRLQLLELSNCNSFDIQNILYIYSLEI